MAAADCTYSSLSIKFSINGCPILFAIPIEKLDAATKRQVIQVIDTFIENAKLKKGGNSWEIHGEIHGHPQNRKFMDTHKTKIFRRQSYCNILYLIENTVHPYR
ncbi:hypothetical protein A3224_14995 [Microbulbifer thermotolerans]|uniref:Uncharacterized protein n=1 Tax=Microbulbifer thermotolerans TaxID=252514 RepID=A0A143HQD8_MICTH|nr:hypothetical protein A3224_14995 [Microbulbifer thermotolerans]